MSFIGYYNDNEILQLLLNCSSLFISSEAFGVAQVAQYANYDWQFGTIYNK